MLAFILAVCLFLQELLETDRLPTIFWIKEVNPVRDFAMLTLRTLYSPLLLDRLTWKLNLDYFLRLTWSPVDIFFKGTYIFFSHFPCRKSITVSHGDESFELESRRTRDRCPVRSPVNQSFWSHHSYPALPSDSTLAMAFRRQVKNFVKNYSEAEIKVREATSNDPWGPSSSLMLAISDMTFNTASLSEIMHMMWQRLGDHGKNWRHVYKCLSLMDYLIKNGSKKVIQCCREGLCNLQMLKDFQHIDEAGKDQGNQQFVNNQTVRHKDMSAGQMVLNPELEQGGS